MSTDTETVPDDYTTDEQRIADGINSAFDRNGISRETVALGVGAAFLLYRKWMSRRLREEFSTGPVPTADVLQRVATHLMGLYGPRWVATALPAATTGVVLALNDGLTASPEMQRRVAESYARALGPAINDVSTRAMVEGYQGMLNRRVVGRAALDRVIDAFGVTPRTMKTLVSVWTGAPQEKVSSTHKRPDRLKDRIDSLISRAISDRAQTLGDTESVSITNSAKVILWSAAYKDGSLPAGTQKMWVTADDERVCPVCAPMDGKRVEISETFQLPDGTRVYAPSTHPNCRCTIKLAVDSVQDKLRSYLTGNQEDYALAKRAPQKSAWGVVAKAVGSDPFDRDFHGRFAANESRRTKLSPVAYKEPEIDFTDPRVEDILNQARTMAPESTKISSPAKVGVKLSSTTKISSAQKIGAKISSPELVSPKLESQKLATAKVDMAKFNSDSLAKVKAKIKHANVAAPSMPAQHSSETSDLWVNTPDNREIYVVAPDWDWNDNGLVTDDSHAWYTGGHIGRGISSLQEAVHDYWSEILDQGDLVHENFMEQAHYSDMHEENVITIRSGNKEMHVPYDAYETAFVESVYGMGPNESEKVEVFVNQEGDNDDWTSYTDTVPAYRIAQELGIHQEVDNLVPVIGASNKVNVDQYDDAAWNGIISNPGVWTKVTGIDRGQTQPWMGREGMLPYRMYDIEPKDLYGD